MYGINISSIEIFHYNKYNLPITALSTNLNYLPRFQRKFFDTFCNRVDAWHLQGPSSFENDTILSESFWLNEEITCILRS